MTGLEVSYPTAVPAIEFGVDRLVDSLRGTGATVTRHDCGETTSTDVVVTVDESNEEIAAEGFAVRRTADGVTVSARDDRGAMYGALEVAERVRRGGGLSAVEETTASPAASFRALKFNLPWSAYRSGEQTQLHYETCRDLDFWRDFLDMMAENRFNALTLWNLHPFPYLVRPEGFPEASQFTDDELTSWRAFWRDLFRMASERGIETYLLNWNIVVSESFAEAHGVEQFNATEQVVRDYTRQCVTQTIDEYPNLDGLGVSLCDWMDGLSPAEKQDWFVDTFVEGIRRAERPIRLLDRSVRTEAIAEMRRGVETAASAENVADVLVPTKFNYSHGHSTTSLEKTHDSISGEVDDSLWEPTPTNYQRVWTVRNEDVFVLRWGDPSFVRDHIRENLQPNDAVAGYIVGSEGYIPAKDLSHVFDTHQTWTYAFEKQWLFYAVWGRLLYDPAVPDAVFEQAFDERYRTGLGGRLLEGFQCGSQMAEELASFHAGTWDYSLYSEGFLAPAPGRSGLDDEVSPFISVDELIDHETLDSSYRTIPEYVAGEDHGVTPPELADTVEARGDRALELADELRTEVRDGDGGLECEIDDVEAWGHLSRYFAAKLRGAVALETFRATGDETQRGRAVDHLRTARDHWDGVAAVTARHYREIPYATEWERGNTFSWTKYRDQVERDVRIAATAEPRE
ncbi:hypothetical protein [Haloarchaeobius sp. TZWSO28]|uniref:hypothetical protein n=1 Tax=Haloarchaeobius sp. TZWSO28 TaxID=3446119 RepID=UPI003EB740CE